VLGRRASRPAGQPGDRDVQRPTGGHEPRHLRVGSVTSWMVPPVWGSRYAAAPFLRRHVVGRAGLGDPRGSCRPRDATADGSPAAAARSARRCRAPSPVTGRAGGRRDHLVVDHDTRRSSPDRSSRSARQAVPRASRRGVSASGCGRR
jgi:hypothetical protein